jgi:hypothetical protein
LRRSGDFHAPPACCFDSAAVPCDARKSTFKARPQGDDSGRAGWDGMEHGTGSQRGVSAGAVFAEVRQGALEQRTFERQAGLV